MKPPCLFFRKMFLINWYWSAFRSAIVAFSTCSSDVMTGSCSAKKYSIFCCLRNDSQSFLLLSLKLSTMFLLNTNFKLDLLNIELIFIFLSLLVVFKKSVVPLKNIFIIIIKTIIMIDEINELDFTQAIGTTVDITLCNQETPIKGLIFTFFKNNQFLTRIFN